MSTLRERLKKIQLLAIQVNAQALMPVGARAGIAETVLLLADLVERIEQLEKEREP